MRIHRIRYLNARLLIAKEHAGKSGGLATKLKKQSEQISNIAPKTYNANGKAIGDQIAIEIEGVYELPEGWMDAPHFSEWRRFRLWSGPVPEAFKEFGEESNSADNVLLAATEGLNSKQIAELVGKAYEMKAPKKEPAGKTGTQNITPTS